MQNIRWAVLGTGVIANEMAVALKKNGRNIDAVGNRTHEKAVSFSEKYGIKKVYDNYNDMFTDPDIDVIYITTPHNTHINFMRRAIENGKHILVEKSITLNSRELDEAIALADKKGVVIGEAMTIFSDLFVLILNATNIQRYFIGCNYFSSKNIHPTKDISDIPKTGYSNNFIHSRFG